MSLRLLKPELYVAASPHPILRGGRCACGYLFFPMQNFGCERCGRSGKWLEPVALKGRGRVLASCVVHVHADKRRPTPFVVGTIALDDGPIVRTLLAGDITLNFADADVEAVLVPSVSEDQSQVLDLRFQLSSPS